MNSKLVGAGGRSEVCIPSKSVGRVPQKTNAHRFVIAKRFVIALLLVFSFLTIVAAMLVYYPQKVDAFLNSDVPVESKHVATSSK
jgi:hypothetical protein